MSVTRTEPWTCNFVFGPFVAEDKLYLAPGVIDSAAVQVFSNGHCHSLAAAVCRVEPVCKLLAVWDDESPDDSPPSSHVYAVFEGRRFDVRGWIDEEHPRETWQHWRQIAEGEWVECSPPDRQQHWFEPRIGDAEPFAKTLLRRVGVWTPDQEVATCR